MDLNEIKQIVLRDGGKLIIIENDRPVFVVLSFEEYKRSMGQQASLGATESQDRFAPRERSMQSGSPRYADRRDDQRAEPPREELTIDDLPL